ncbi:hypothetical protein PCANB_002316 [Pneumocystis canis]|nr:hypothetical protein PCK1_002259 [Pneumocystis canis]KAG5438986.1 hypothetical protein PCANB_002316 [Pneumocystis canis]
MDLKTPITTIRHRRKQTSPLRSAEAKNTSNNNTFLERINELEPGIIFNFEFLWPYNRRTTHLVSPTSNTSNTSFTSENNEHNENSENSELFDDSGVKTPSSQLNGSLSCNISSFPLLLGQIIDYERKKRTESTYEKSLMFQETKKASGSIILSSKRLQCMIKDSEEKKREDLTNKNDLNDLNDLSHLNLKPPYTYDISGISSAYPDTDLEFWRSNLQKQMRERHYSSQALKKKLPTRRILTSVSKRQSNTYQMFHNKNQDTTQTSTSNSVSSTEEQTTSIAERRCVSCGCSNTPCWRPSWYGNTGLLCNSCGLRYKKIGVRCLNKNCRHIPLRSEFREMKSRVKGNAAIDCIKCGGEVKIRGQNVY